MASNKTSSTNQPETQAPQPKLAVRTFSAIPRKQVRWLWHNRIPLGKLCLLIGDPKCGKSLLTADIAVRLSRGSDWPDGSPCDLGDTLIASAEDDAEDTIGPRLDAAGADCSRVHCLDGVLTGSREDFFALGKTGLELLDAELAARPEIRLVVLDPVMAFSVGDTHKDSDVRRMLSPLAKLAAARGVAVLAIIHLNKGGGGSQPVGNAMYRAMGSLGFVAAARACHALLKDPENPARRLLLPVACNLSPDAVEGLAFTIEAEHGLPRLAWEPDPVRITAEDALAPTPQDPSPTALQDATEWLRRVMGTGELPASEGESLASKEKIALSTLRRAMRRLGIRSEKRGAGWVWIWPAAEEGLRSLQSLIHQPLDKLPRA